MELSSFRNAIGIDKPESERGRVVNCAPLSNVLIETG